MKVYDKDMRVILFRDIINRLEFTNDPATVVVNELDVCFGCAIVDVAVINGRLYGFEIKSERDSLDRLPSQAGFYAKTFDEITIVTTEKHYSKAKKMLPVFWGIEIAYKDNDDKLYLESYRQPEQNYEIDAFSLLSFLWKNELLELFRNNGITKGIKSKTRYELAEKATEVLTFGTINNFVKKTLKTRKGWRALRLKHLCDDLRL